MLEGLGVSEEVAKADACKLEHDISNESFEKIKEHLKGKVDFFRIIIVKYVTVRKLL